MTSRRGFMKRVGALAGSGPIILGAQNKSGSAKPILGEGDHTYEVTHDWGELPANIKYGNTHGVCEDSQGQIYVHHTDQSYEAIERTLDRDHFMSVDEAKAFGIVDEVTIKRTIELEEAKA